MCASTVIGSQGLVSPVLWVNGLSHRLAYGMIRAWLPLRPFESLLVEPPWPWLGVVRGLSGE